MITAIGYVAAVIDVAQFAPQLWRVLSRRHDAVALRGLSVTAYALATAQALLWVVYGFATDRLPVGLANLAIAPACAVILALAVRARRSPAATAGGA